METDMEPYVETLVPALRRLHDVGDATGALRLVEVIADLCEDTAGIGEAAALLDIAERIDGGPVSVPLACLGAARVLFDGEEFGHGVGSCDVLAAELFAATGQTDRALELYDDGLELLDAELDPGFAGRAWHNHGILLRQVGRPAESLASEQRALAAYRATGQATPTADSHVGIGIALCDLGRADEALEPYAAARALYLEFGDDELVADTDDRRGLALCDLGRYPEAAAAHAAAVARYEQLDEDWLAARARRYRSHPLDHAGEHAEALAELEAARAVFVEHGDDLGVARCDAATAAALLGVGQSAAARPLLASARQVLAAHDLPDEADWCALLLDDPASISHGHPEER